jgi:hypothetical protein
MNKAQAEEIMSGMAEILDNDVHISVAESGLTGISAVNKIMPSLLIVGNLPDMQSLSFSTMVKKNIRQCSIQIYTIININEYQCMNNALTDILFFDNGNFKNALFMQVQIFIAQKKMRTQYADEIERAKSKQKMLIPPRLETEKIQVDGIYSPFSLLSGDGIDFWLSEDSLYGFLFDCTGHDIVSSTEAGTVRTLLRTGFKFFQQLDWTLSDILKNANEISFSVSGDDALCAAAVIFYFDLKNNELRYCSAGMPNFYVRKKDGLHEVKMNNFLLGYEANAEYAEKSLKLSDIDEVIFLSDGFSELLFSEIKTNMAIHDDISAIFVKLKEKGA